MHIRAKRCAGAIAVAVPLVLAACAQTPMGPTVQVMPGANKPFNAFQTDQVVCKQFAEQAIAGQAHNANMRGVGAGALTTVLGAGLGAAIGGGRGAAMGAAGGALGGGGIGAMASSRGQASIQQQYNNAYAQCMYSKGNQVPGYAPRPEPAATYGSLTQAVQMQLIRLGYLHGAADGTLGPQTSAAISNFQRASGVPIDGEPSAALLARLQGMP
ncbi:MAG: peptidoglycan-binding domain-containing protein [Acetobacteraceae bacterium]